MPRDIAIKWTHCSRWPVTPEDAADRVASSTDLKPAGLWLAHDSMWMQLMLCYGPDFCKEFTGSRAMRNMHVYRVHLNMNSLRLLEHRHKRSDGPCVLMLRSRADVMHFHNSYRMERLPHNARKERIDWTRVARDYDGIFVVCTRDAMQTDPLWYFRWEVPSMCLWRPCTVGVRLNEVPCDHMKRMIKGARKRVRSQLM